jgi:hypothetical protein
MEFEIETHVKTLHQHCTLHMSRSQSVDYWKKATLIERTANARCLFKLFSPLLLFIYNLLTLGYRVLSKWFGFVRLACVLSRAPSTDGTPMFTQSSLLASVFEVVDFLAVGGRGLLSVGCGDLSYGLYCSWPLL